MFPDFKIRTRDHGGDREIRSWGVCAFGKQRPRFGSASRLSALHVFRIWSRFFFSGVGFAAPAVSYADEMEIRLFKYTLDGGMEPINAAARSVVATCDLASRLTPFADSRRLDNAEQPRH